MRIGFDGMPFTLNWIEGMLVYNNRLLGALTELRPSDEYWFFFQSLRQDFNDVPLPGSSNNRKKSIVRLPALPYLSFIPSNAINLELYFDVYLPYLLKKNKIEIFHGLFYQVPRRTKARVVTTFHDIFACSIPWALAPEEIHIRKKWYAKALKRSDIIIAVSESTKQELIMHYDVNPEYIIVIPLASSSVFKPIKDDNALKAVKNKYALPEHFILGLGATHKRKTPETLLRAYAESIKMQDHECDLVFFGGGLGLQKTWAGLMQDLKINSRVKFIHSISAEELAVLYSMAELFVLPSKFEGFGIPILEAMACGTPVITSNISAMPEVAGGAAKLIDPFNQEELATAISNIVEDDSLKNEMKRRGLIRASLFSWEKTARETASVYDAAYSSLRSTSTRNQRPNCIRSNSAG